jgi:hypothetical protein
MNKKLTQSQRIENLLLSVKIESDMRHEEKTPLTAIVRKHGFSGYMRSAIIEAELINGSTKKWSWVGDDVTSELVETVREHFKTINRKSKEREANKALELNSFKELSIVEEPQPVMRKIVASTIDGESIGILLEILINNHGEERIYKREFEAKLLEKIEKNNVLMSSLVNKFDKARGASL